MCMGIDQFKFNWVTHRMCLGVDTKKTEPFTEFYLPSNTPDTLCNGSKVNMNASAHADFNAHHYQ